MKTKKKKAQVKLTRREIEAREDAIDIRDARRILRDPKTKFMPWAKVKKQLGLE